MPRFRYTGPDRRVFLGPPAREVSPGDEIEADQHPGDGLFEALDEAAEDNPDEHEHEAAPQQPEESEEGDR